MNAVEAFRQLSEQTSTEFLFPYDLAESRTTQAVVGRHTVLDALDIMLRDTGLASGLSEKGAITIFLSDSAFDSLEGRRNMKSTKKNILASTIAFFVGAGGVNAGFAQESVGGDSGYLLEEVIVTANRREEKLQDVAMAVTAIDPQGFTSGGLVSLIEILTYTPGFSSNNTSGGANTGFLVVRGVSPDPDGKGTATTAVYLDGVALGSSAPFGGGGAQ